MQPAGKHRRAFFVVTFQATSPAVVLSAARILDTQEPLQPLSKDTPQSQQLATADWAHHLKVIDGYIVVALNIANGQATRARGCLPIAFNLTQCRPTNPADGD